MRRFLSALAAIFPLCLAGQAGGIQGEVRDERGSVVARASVRVMGTDVRTLTDHAGRFRLEPVRPGVWSVEIRALGFAPLQRTVPVGEEEVVIMMVRLERRAFDLGAILVEGASRQSEEVLETPVAVAVAPREAIRAATLSGETPRALRHAPGVDIVQSDLFDYNINARGFNATLNRSILVLVDGRDVAVPFLGSQEWAGVSFAPEDLQQVEFIRGPGSALYGANAFNGVVNITTPAVREAIGTRVTVGGGMRETFRADVRHAGELVPGRLGYRVSGGYQRALGWSAARTLFDASDFADEYAAAGVDSVLAPPPGFEQVALNGQTTDPLTGVTTGDPLPVINYYGTGRMDWYRDGRAITVDGGTAYVENEVFMTGIGRFQVDAAVRPWARARYASGGLTVSGWYSGRRAIRPQRLLSGNQPVDDQSSMAQLEAQVTRPLAPGLQVILGSSARQQRVNTFLTLMDAENDDRADTYYAVFGQVDWRLASRFRFVAAARFDAGNLFDAQVSPRAALIWRVGDEHAVRLTASGAFLTPSQIEYFLSATAATTDLSPLESGLRASPLGAALAAVPPGSLFTTSSAVPVLVRGNRNLRPEHIRSIELGYKGRPIVPLFLTVDAFFSRRSDFVTSLLPATALNPDYPSWTAPEDVAAALRPVVEGGIRDALAGTIAQYGLTRLPNGQTAIVLSYGNAGLAEDYGVESGASLWLARWLRVDGSATWYRSDIKQQAAGDTLVPNTPELKGTVGITYQGTNGLDVGLHLRTQQAFAWRSGLYRGEVPAYTTVDLNVAWQVTPLLLVHGVAMNVFDDRHFEVYGGAVTGRRLLGGITATF